MRIATSMYACDPLFTPIMHELEGLAVSAPHRQASSMQSSEITVAVRRGQLHFVIEVGITFVNYVFVD